MGANLFRDVSFQASDRRTQLSSPQLFSDVQTVGRQTSNVTSEEFDGYEKAIIKSSSFHRKRSRRKQEMDSAQDKINGMFGCCSGLYSNK